MFIKDILIKNFRLFSDINDFKIENFNIPDNTNEWSWLNIIVWENWYWKSTLLDALSLPVLWYKTDTFSINDFYNPINKCKIQVLSWNDFDYSWTMPKIKYKWKWFLFEAWVRTRWTSSFLSSIIVTDQKYIRANWETKPEDWKPDLRLSVNNPWSWARFSENDILFLDKNRTYQTRTWTYNTTRFDRLMEDLDFQYIKQDERPLDCNIKLEDVKTWINNTFLVEAIEKFYEISDYKLSLSLIENWKPFSKWFFWVVKENKQIISLDSLWSGYEMIFSLLYSFYLSKQSWKQLIILIDEPELHLHPKLQEDFIKIILDISKTSQIFITTHSPLFIKQVLYNELVNIFLLKKDNNNIIVSWIDKIALSYISANEINFIAFDLITEEYHNELYEELKSIYWEKLNIFDFDIHFFQWEKWEPAIYNYNPTNPEKCSVHTYIRNQIHHRWTNWVPDIDKIKESTIIMRNFLLKY